MVTDGASTESLAGAGSRLADAAVPLDLRLENRSDAGDSGITRVTAPPQVQAGQGFSSSSMLSPPRTRPYPLNCSVMVRESGQARFPYGGGEGMDVSPFGQRLAGRTVMRSA